jgi:hypothetical protein
MTNKELFIDLFNKELKNSLKEHFSKKAIESGEGGWKLNVKYCLEDIIYKIIGLHPTDYALYNTPKLSKYKLRVDIINGDFFLIPFDAQAVYFDAELNDIVIEEAPKKPGKKQTLGFNIFIAKDTKIFLGYL